MANNANGVRSEIQGEQSGSSLDDICLLQIINRLSIADLCEMIDVNKQFERVSMHSFSILHKTFKLPDDLETDDPPPYKQIRRVLCKFGPFIKKLRMNCYSYEIEMDVISSHCTEIDELDLRLTLSLDCDSAKPLFAILKKLKVSFHKYSGDIRGLFSQCGQLKVLIVDRVPHDYNFFREVSAIVQNYPNLEELNLMPLHVKSKSEILKLNPQIKILKMYDYRIDKTICSAAQKMDKLEVLILNRASDYYVNTNALNKFKYLTSLKVLELHDIPSEFIIAIDAMANITLESFKWFRCPSSLEFVKSILKLKTLKTLALSKISSPFDDFLLQLGEQLPRLENLELRFESSKEFFFSTGCVKHTIELSKALCAFTIHTNHSNLFDQKFYDLLLSIILIRSHSKEFLLKIFGKKAMPLEMKSHLLHVEYDSMPSD